MKTPYVNMSLKTQEQLASFLAFRSLMFKEYGISLYYTEGYESFPEKVLNLKWSFLGTWKTIQLATFFKDKNRAVSEMKMLFDICRKKDGFAFAGFAKFLTNLGKGLEVSGQSFSAGVDNLYKHLSSSEEIEVEGKKFVFPILIVRSSENFFWGIYCFIPERGFVNMYNNKDFEFFKDFLNYEDPLPKEAE